MTKILDAKLYDKAKRIQHLAHLNEPITDGNQQVIKVIIMKQRKVTPIVHIMEAIFPTMFSDLKMFKNYSWTSEAWRRRSWITMNRCSTLQSNDSSVIMSYYKLPFLFAWFAHLCSTLKISDEIDYMVEKLSDLDALKQSKNKLAEEAATLQLQLNSLKSEDTWSKIRTDLVCI